MRAKQRIQALKYLEKQKRNPELAKKLGIEVKVLNASDNKDYK